MKEKDPFIKCNCPEDDRFGTTAMWVCNCCGKAQSYYRPSQLRQILEDYEEYRAQQKPNGTFGKHSQELIDGFLPKDD